MGTRVAPTYANLFMADFEEKFVYTRDKQPLIWLRFIDDIFFVWTHGLEELNAFTNEINLVHQSIKFTSEISHSEVHFLDLPSRSDLMALLKLTCL